LNSLKNGLFRSFIEDITLRSIKKSMYVDKMHIGTLSLANNIFLAPMAGITDLIFRTFAREFGASLCFTEMISANGLVRKTERSYRYLDSSVYDRPLGVQIFGSDPDTLSEAARIVAEMGADLVDINMGCPVKKVLKTGSGAFLMKEPEKVSRIMKKVRSAVSLPLTIKIRSGWQKVGINAEDIAERAQDCGIDAVILHPRTVEQGFSGAADWGLIKRVRDRLKIPLIGSGDIRTPEDAFKMIEESGCNGVMVGRGALGNPWIFKKILDCSPGSRHFPSLNEREDIINRHLGMTVGMYGETFGMKKFRKHLLWYTKGLKGGAQFRQSVVSVVEKKAMLDAVHAYLRTLAELNSKSISICLQRD
jgi:tRNA-dihydrouridine synthase B